MINDSPLRLTELGQAISDNLNARVWASKAAESIKNHIVGLDAYATQEFRFDCADDEKLYTDDEIHTIRENGSTDSQVRQIMSIELRDILRCRYHQWICLNFESEMLDHQNPANLPNTRTKACKFLDKPAIPGKTIPVLIQNNPFEGMGQG